MTVGRSNQPHDPYTKVRYRGLFKNEQHLFSQFALVNLYIARRVITPAA